MPALINTPGASLGEFQNAFAAALLDSAAPPAAPIEALVSQPGFAVYRNTVMKACIDALQANYPSVSRLVGEEWFRAAAAIFARAHPPVRASLIEYGAGFADFLAAFPPAKELRYLTGVATVDRFWSESHAAQDQPRLAAAEVARLDAETLGHSVLRPHASARWQWFPEEPIATLWRSNHSPERVIPKGYEWRGEGILLVRPNWEVTDLQLDRAGIAFLDACGQGQPAGEAALATLLVDPAADLAMLLSNLLEAGAFTGVEIS